jgi:excisionase family DNA binding protein
MLAVDYETAGEMMTMSKRSIARLVAEGRLRTIGKGSGRRIPVVELERFIAEELDAAA